MPKRRRTAEREPVKRRKANFNARVRRVIMKTAETKSKTSNWNATAISTTPDSTLLSTIATGDGSGARDGNEIYLRSLYGRVTLAKSVSSTNSLVRIVAYTPKQESNKLSSLDFISRIDPDEQTVWFDRLITLNDDYPVKRVTLKKRWYRGRIPGMRCDWITGSGTTVLHNPVYLVMVSNEATNTVSATGDVTVYYKDP